MMDALVCNPSTLARRRCKWRLIWGAGGKMAVDISSSWDLLRLVRVSAGSYVFFFFFFWLRIHLKQLN